MLNYGPAVLIIVSVFVGILVNRRDVTRLCDEMRLDVMGLRDEMRREFDEVNRRLGLIESDQKHFFEVTGKLDGRIDQLSRS